MNIQTTIGRLGYSPHEVTVYLAVLELGESTVTDIADKAQIPRTTASLVVKSLHDKGLLNTFLLRKRKIWVAENPQVLFLRFKENEEALNTIMPELQSMRHDTGTKLMVSIYSGTKEIKQIMNDILETKHNISAILSWDDWIALLGKSYMDDFIENRVRRYLRIRLLTPKTKTSLTLKEKDAQELRVTKFLHPELLINNSNFIYGNKVAIISIRAKRPVGILIEDEDINHTQEVLFENLWNQSKYD